jgi:hypothetical protein
MWSPHGLGMGGKDGSADGAGRGSRPCGVGGESLVEVWRGGKVLVALERAPLGEGAPFLQRQGLKPFQEVW